MTPPPLMRMPRLYNLRLHYLSFRKVSLAVSLLVLGYVPKFNYLLSDSGPEAKSSSDGIGRAPVKEPAVFFNAHPANKTQNKATVNAGRPGYSLTSW